MMMIMSKKINFYFSIFEQVEDFQEIKRKPENLKESAEIED
jgi:hypothetical protein